MHVAYVCGEYPPRVSANGVSVYTGLMAEEMAGQGHHVSVFCLDGGDGAGRASNVELDVYPIKASGFRVPVLRVAFYRVGGWLFPGHFQSRDAGACLRDAVAEVHRTHPIDLVECPEARGIPSWLESLNIPVVVRLHAPRSVTAAANGARLDKELRGIRRAERRCLERARYLTAPSRAIVVETERTLGITLEDVAVIPNPFRASSADAPETARKLGRELLFVGRLDLLKGFDGLIEGFKQVASKPEFRDVRLTVAGPDRGLLLDGRRAVSGREYVRRNVADESIRSRIDLLGSLPFDEVQELRHRRPITIVPSRFESFGNVVVEAMAAECAVVASDVGGLAEIVEHERTGLLFALCDWDDLARQVERLLVDEDLRIRLGLRAREDVHERFHSTRVARLMTDYYQQIVPAARRAASAGRSHGATGLPEGVGR